MLAGDKEKGSTQAIRAVNTWIQAVISPNLGTYTNIVNDTGVSTGKAAAWLALGGMISGLLAGLRQFGLNDQLLSPFLEGAGLELPSINPGIGIVGSAVAGVLLSLVFGFLYASIVHLVSRTLGGRGGFQQLFYTFAAFQVPIMLLLSALGFVPLLGACITFPVLFYGLILSVIANKAVYGYEYGQAAIASLAPSLVFVILTGCLFAFGATLIRNTVQQLLDMNPTLPVQ